MPKCTKVGSNAIDNNYLSRLYWAQGTRCAVTGNLLSTCSKDSSLDRIEDAVSDGREHIKKNERMYRERRVRHFGAPDIKYR
jgi:hypothetical protein